MSEATTTKADKRGKIGGKPRFLRGIDLDRLRIDGGTQQRPINDDALEAYTDLAKAGSEAPPVWAVYDGKDYWLWDGFHRYHSYRAAGIAKIPLYVHDGTKRDAVWLSFSANKDHGVRRDRGVLRSIIESILADKEWKAIGAKQIAEHVGASSRYVEAVQSDLRNGRAHRPNNSEDAPAADRTQKRTVNRNGQTYEMDVSRMAKGNGEADKPAEEPKPVVDANGDPVEDKAIADVFRRGDEVRAILSAISSVKKSVVDPAENKDPLFHFVHLPTFTANLSNARQAVKDGVPYALCPAHASDKTARKDCRWCDGRGWLPESKYKLAKAAKDQGSDAKDGENGKS